MKYTILIFSLIIFIATFLRIWHLSGVPITPNWDEVSLGYNAYSILLTGKDEYGELLPLSIRSFNDYKPPMYVYAAIPSIAFFGLNAFAVRFPSVIMGVLAVIGTFFLTRELLLLDRSNKHALSISLLASFLLAISPWHVQFSRVAYEANIALSFTIFGLLFFLMGLRKSMYFIPSVIFYGLALHSYHSQKLFIPLFTVGLCLLFIKQINISKKYLCILLCIIFLFLSPFIYFVSQNQLYKITGRFSQTSIFNNANSKTNSSNTYFGINYLLFDFPVLTKLYEIPSNYLSHFSPKWLFITGDNDRHHAPSTGLLYIWEAPFLFAGLLTLLCRNSKLRSILFLWLFLAPVPASLTSEVPHAVRTLLFLPSFQIIIALGIYVSFFYFRKFSIAKQLIFFAWITVIVIFLFFQYFYLYFFQMNHEVSNVWQFGYGDAVSYVNQHREQHKKVVVSTKLEQPYIFFLFYTRYDPKSYLSNGGTRKTNAFDIFTFREIDLQHEVHDGKTLYVLAPIEMPSNPLHIIRFFDSNPAIIFSE